MGEGEKGQKEGEEWVVSGDIEGWQWREKEMEKEEAMVVW